MSHSAALVGAVLLGLVVAVAAGPTATAGDQDEGRMGFAEAWKRAPAVTVAARWPLTPDGSTGWGFACLDVRNDDAVPRDVRLEAFDDWGGEAARGRVTRTVHVPSRATVRTWLPLVAPAQTFVVAQTAGAAVRLGDHGRSGWGPVVVVRDGSAAMERLADALGAASLPGFRARSITFSTVEATMLPPTPAWLTAATLIIVDAAAAGLDDGARQRTLVRWMRLGGTLVVLGRASLPRGPLRDALDAKQPGFGRLLGFDEASLSEAGARRVAALWLTGREDGDVSHVVHVPALVNSALAAGEEIPGLGRAPVRAFFVILLAFATVAGPVAYLTLRRRRRLTWMVWVVPVLGTVFALAILGYGIVAEGFGTRGVERTYSVLDQRDHTCATVGGRTLFTGWSPSDLPLGPDAAVWSGQPGDDDWGYYRQPEVATPRVEFDVDAGKLDGALLPSRTVTPIAVAVEGRARERLRFRRRPDGGLDVTASDGFAPVAGPATIVVRDAAGAFFVGGGGGPLRPVTPAEATGAFEALRSDDDARFVPLESTEEEELGYLRFRRRGAGSTRPEGLRQLDAWRASRLPAELAPGTYVARTTRAPHPEHLGLDVAWERSVHLVVGILAEDDLDG